MPYSHGALPLRYDDADGWMRHGRVTGLSDCTLTVRMPSLIAGSLVSVARSNASPLLAQVRSIDEDEARCRPLGPVHGVAIGAQASSERARLGCYVGSGLLGSSVDAWGRGAAQEAALVAAHDSSLAALSERVQIRQRLTTGVAAIDAFATMGYGQRIALFAGAGVGKSTLLRRIVDGAAVDARVVALIGERAREAAEAVASLSRSPQWASTTLVCATADAPPAERLAAALTSTAQAEHLAGSGKRVLLVMDSLTRVATAWRELALADGEPAAHRGHPPSLVGALARLVERAGAFRHGSLTAVYAVLVDGDDPYEPVTDALRALLDGHITLCRRLADSGRYPAVDVLRSLSRIMPLVAADGHRRDAALVRRALDTLEKYEDLFAIGAYERGGDFWLDAAVQARPLIEALIFSDSPAVDSTGRLAEIAGVLRAAAGPNALGA